MSSNMNAQVRKETTYTNEEGEEESRVETVDYRSLAGQRQEVKNVEVIRQSHANQDNSSGGVLANAARTVASTLHSAKDLVSDK